MSEKIRGRYFTLNEIMLIKSIVEENYNKGRSYASVEICKTLDWKQPNGWLKDRACRDVLRFLEKKGYIELPPSMRIIKNKKNMNVINPEYEKTAITSLVFSEVEVEQVKGTKQEKVWNYFVDNYHYLGFKVFVGRSLKYLVYHEKRVIAAVGYCDTAWSISIRDKLFKSFGYNKNDLRLNGINNGRFLIMPWVNVKNLASFIIARLNKQVRIDWNNYYSIDPLFVETFVDPSRFYGTCYKASNWFFVGESCGYLKKGSSHHNSQIPKHMYIHIYNKKLKRKMKEKLSECDYVISE